MVKKKSPRRGLGIDSKGRSKEDKKHVRLNRWLLESPAYYSLSHLGRSALVEMYYIYNGSNNGELFMSVRALGVRLDCHKDTANKALKELEEKGFIRANEHGSFDQKQNLATTYILTEYSYREAQPMKEFLRWQPDKSDDQAAKKLKPGPND